MSNTSQDFRLFHISNLSVLNFLIFLLMYPGSVSGERSEAEDRRTDNGPGRGGRDDGQGQTLIRARCGGTTRPFPVPPPRLTALCPGTRMVWPDCAVVTGCGAELGG